MGLLAVAPIVARLRKEQIDAQSTSIVNALGKSLKAGKKKRGSRFGK